MLEQRDALLARLIAETDTLEEWQEHEAYCDYVQTTLAWLEEGCCDGDRMEANLACDDLHIDMGIVYEEGCDSQPLP